MQYRIHNQSVAVIFIALLFRFWFVTADREDRQEEDNNKEKASPVTLH
jgi:hypothetical protein